MTNSEKLIELKDVCYAYGGEIALRYINLDVFRGETIILEGPNGCGKSTLMRLMNGLLYPEEGSYLFEGRKIDEKSMKDARFSKWFHQRMGFVFQNSDVQLFCSNVEEEIAFGPVQMGLSAEEVTKRTEDVLRLLKIEHLRNRAPYHLSGGEKKKTAIACILSMNPEVLVMDEPLAGLDRQTQEWLLGFLLKLKQAGRTMVIATHNEQLSQALADRRLLFNDNHEAFEEPN
ncbi:MAG: ABC transporter ATP-binding protein [Eubacterium sp.]|nr:ABC transporter ATP-binding protein [Eubacterium sp.]